MQTHGDILLVQLLRGHNWTELSRQTGPRGAGAEEYGNNRNFAGYAGWDFNEI